ncbi:hypothetical protein Patl1_27702 [Pistacia atlantica]|uniref:Uncharacterized protein n=2 Tax=Pistacia atlantica TaxID=434234 RepID=A0ACC1BGZ9_9ROSI|nr:hypothetical protein Patl1_27702 [Pistacia atlantica]
MVMKERDEELALFLEMRKRKKEKSNLLLLHNSDDINSNSTPLGPSKHQTLPVHQNFPYLHQSNHNLLSEDHVGKLTVASTELLYLVSS